MTQQFPLSDVVKYSAIVVFGRRKFRVEIFKLFGHLFTFHIDHDYIILSLPDVIVRPLPRVAIFPCTAIVSAKIISNFCVSIINNSRGLPISNV